MATEIPLLDLSQIDNLLTRTILLEELRIALLEVGFLYIKGHGVSERIVESLQDLLPALFDLPIEIKQESALVKSPHFLGYSNFGSETTAKVQDQREQFEFATELPNIYARDPSQPLYVSLQGPNQWPKWPAETRQIVSDYIAELTLLSDRFLRLVAECLDLPDGTFLPFTGQQNRLKLVHYRPSSDPLHPSQGVGPHKDSSGWMTFLLQASDPSIRGLQALSKSGKWIDVPAMPGTFVVNMGQAFEVVTNGVCKATTHRVLLPPGNYDRYSVPFFSGVRMDLSKEECKALWSHFVPEDWKTKESEEGQRIDSAFLKGKYETWGESQLRTKIRSHRDVAMMHYPEVYEMYVSDAG